MPVSTYAIASDLSGVIETEDGFGRFATLLEATEHWIRLLEGEKQEIAQKLSRARRLRRRLGSAAQVQA